MDFSSSFINLKELYTFTKTLIGNGTYSNAYIVNDKETNKQYAAKILKYSIDEMPVQFLNELNVLRSLRYPSIIKFIGFSYKNFKDENYPTIIVEYLKNSSLFNLLNEVHKGNKELTNTKKMMILLGVALGIEYLHKHWNYSL